MKKCKVIDCNKPVDDFPEKGIYGYCWKHSIAIADLKEKEENEKV